MLVDDQDRAAGRSGRRRRRRRAENSTAGTRNVRISRLTAVFELVDSTTTTVSPKRTMLPPIWVARLGQPEQQERPVAEDGEGAPPARASASTAVLAGGRGHVARPAVGRSASRRDARRVSAGSPRWTKPASRRSSVAPLDQDVPAAGLAAQPDVGAEPIDEPRVAAARMRPPQADDVAEQQLRTGRSGTAGRVSEHAGWPCAGHEVALRGGQLDRGPPA